MLNSCKKFNKTTTKPYWNSNTNPLEISSIMSMTSLSTISLNTTTHIISKTINFSYKVMSKSFFNFSSTGSPWKSMLGIKLKSTNIINDCKSLKNLKKYKTVN